MFQPLVITGTVGTTLWAMWEASVWGRRFILAVLMVSTALYFAGIREPQRAAFRLLRYNACQAVSPAIRAVGKSINLNWSANACHRQVYGDDEAI